MTRFLASERSGRPHGQPHGLHQRHPLLAAAWPVGGLLISVAMAACNGPAEPTAATHAATAAPQPAPVRREGNLIVVPEGSPLRERLQVRSEEHTSELQSRQYLVCRLLLEKKKDSLPTTSRGSGLQGDCGCSVEAAFPAMAAPTTAIS